jgi:antitoxin MazE
MVTKLIRIGNSQGIRIPKLLLDQLQFNGELDLSVESGSLVVKPKRKPRDGWEESARLMHENGDDELIIPDTLPNEFDAEEWTW